MTTTILHDSVESISSSMISNEAYGDISCQNNDLQMTKNPYYGDTSAVGRTRETAVHSTQDGSKQPMKTNTVYGIITEPQISKETCDYACNPDSAIGDPPTVQNSAYSDTSVLSQQGPGATRTTTLMRDRMGQQK